MVRINNSLLSRDASRSDKEAMMKMELLFDAQEVKDALIASMNSGERMNLSSHNLEITLNKHGAVLKTKEKPPRKSKKISKRGSSK